MLEKIKKAAEEKGALMLEAIALLGLMTMMSPMVVRQTADRSAEMEEVAVAGQMKTLRDAVSSYIDANYATIAAQAGDTRVLTTDELRPYLPPAFIQADGSIGNKLVDNYKVGIRRECTENNGGACARYKVTGLIASGLNTPTGGNLADKSDELDDRRAARIATMIGADGGYIRSSRSVESLYSGGEVETQAKKVIGAQGVWEIQDINDFFPASGWTPGRGRVVATTTYASGISGDFLYRHQVNGLPDANTMFTNIDMGGGGAHHQIRSSGGLEVIGGKLVVKAAAATSDDDAETQVSATEVRTKGFMKAEDGAEFLKGTSSFKVDSGLIEGKIGTASTKLTSGEWRADTSAGNISVNSEGYNAKVGSGEIKLTNSGYERTDKGTTVASSGNWTQSATGTATLSAAGAFEAKSTGGDITLSGKNAYLDATTQAEVTAGSYGFAVASTKAFKSQAARVIGGLDVKSELSVTDGSDKRRIYTKADGTTSYIYMNNSGTNEAGSGNNDIRLSSSNTKGGELNLGYNNVHYLTMKAGGNATTDYPLMEIRNKSNQLAIDARAETDAMVRVYDGYSGGGATVALHGRSGKVNAGYMEPERIALTSNPSSSGSYGNPVRSWGRVTYNDLGALSGSLSGTGKNDATFASQLADSSGPVYKNYNSGDTTEGGKYNKYRVDPAFISVMNDIKLTSRGGARLSESLPNYINKGIYVLSNSYGAGPWPCSSGGGNCSFYVPRLKKPGGGPVVGGGWEHDCGTMKTFLKGGATCDSEGANGFRVSYYAGSYSDCGNASCLSHPFMGVVPAPGRSVSTSSYGAGSAETMSGYDEGRCPDGYVPVMTLTPTAFDVGKVNFIDLNILVDVNQTEGAAYNLEYQNFSSNRASIYQPATSVQVATEQVKSGNDIIGWKVAMGTVTYANNADGYVWNMGGIFNGRMEAIAHTYCYFNPSRFNFPNMKTDGSVLTPIHNPAL